MRLAVIQKNEAKIRKTCLIIDPYFILLCRHILFQGATKSWDVSVLSLIRHEVTWRCLSASRLWRHLQIKQPYFPLLTTVEVRCFQSYTVISQKIKCCNATAESECGLNASFTFRTVCICHTGWGVFIFSPLTRVWVSEERSGRGSAKMITFTSSSLLYLRRIQTPKPLTVGVKGPKRIYEILTLGTSASWEDAVEKKHHWQALTSLF